MTAADKQKEKDKKVIARLYNSAKAKQSKSRKAKTEEKQQAAITKRDQAKKAEKAKKKTRGTKPTASEAACGTNAAQVGVEAGATHTEKKRQAPRSTRTGPSRAELMDAAKAMGIKYFRILSKAELTEVLGDTAPYDTQKCSALRLSQIQDQAKTRWQAGWGNKGPNIRTSGKKPQEQPAAESKKTAKGKHAPGVVVLREPDPQPETAGVGSKS